MSNIVYPTYDFANKSQENIFTQNQYISASLIISGNLSGTTVSGTTFRGDLSGTSSFSHDSEKLGNIASSNYALKSGVTFTGGVTGSFSGSFLGTSSFSDNTNNLGGIASSNYALASNVSSSFARLSATNTFTQEQIFQQDLIVSGSKGIKLDASNDPIITRGYDPFTSGDNSGLGRWGLFMEPYRLVAGIPDSSLGTRYFSIGTFETDGTRKDFFTVQNDSSVYSSGSINLKNESSNPSINFYDTLYPSNYFSIYKSGDTLKFDFNNNTKMFFESDGSAYFSDHIRFPDGKGINFSAVTGSGRTSTILDDYEEGTWSPDFSGSTQSALTSVEYSSQAGTYIKIGNQVTVTGHLQVSDLTPNLPTPPYSPRPGPTGELRIPLPFSVKSAPNNRWFGIVGIYTAMSGGADIDYIVEAVQNSNYLCFRRAFNTVLDCNVLSDTTFVRFSLTYFNS